MSKQLQILAGAAIFAALALAGALGIFAFSGAQPVHADSHVTRSFSEMQVATGGTVDVMITKVGGGFLASVTETLPDGWDYQSASVPNGDSVTVTENGQMITFNVLSGEPVTYTVMAPSMDGRGMFSGMASIDGGAASAVGGDMYVTVGDGNGGTTDPMPMTGDYSVMARPTDPGAVTQITIRFENPSFLEIDDSITFEVEDDLDVPSSIDAGDVSIAGRGAESLAESNNTNHVNPQVAAPASVIVEYDAPNERHEITLHIADMSTGSSAAEATDDGLAAGPVTVTFRQSAGITNRTEGDYKSGNRGADDWYVYTSEVPTEVKIHDHGPVYDVPWLVALSSYKDGRGEEITAVGKGFKNGTTVRFWRDQDGDGAIDTNETELCNATANGDDIAECSFTLANPPFVGGTEDSRAPSDEEYRGVNSINAVDGRGNQVKKNPKGTLPVIELEPSITITPEQGAPGDSINVQVLDLQKDDRIAWIRLARRDALCGSKDTTSADADDCAGFFDTGSNSAGGNGVLSFSFEIPSQVGDMSISPGIQDLRVDTVGGKDANTNIAIATGDLQLSSTNVLPNQRVSISASGFTKSSNKANDRAAWFGGKRPESLGADDHGCTDGDQGSVKLGGQDIPWNRVNDGDGVEVTSGGTWSAPLDLPVNKTTTVAGTYELRIEDCRGGIATVDLTFPQREVTITPDEGGVGSEVVISGKNFPVENDHSPRKAYEVQVIYDADEEDEEDDVDPNAVGSFTIILEVPEDATIPSNNTVSVQFIDGDGGNEGAPVLETFTHRIPQGTISFDRDTGPENSVLTVEAKGFARYTSLDKVEFGDRDILPLPKPSTDTNGNGEFQIRIPGADPGIFIIRVEIADVVATHTFTVIEGGGAEDAKVETVLGKVIAEDGLDRIFRFDNATKMWQWYILDPAFASTNNLGGLSSGDLVYIKVTKDVTADVLGTSITLTCTNAGTDTEDCWNLVAIP